MKTWIAGAALVIVAACARNPPVASPPAGTVTASAQLPAPPAEDAEWTGAWDAVSTGREPVAQIGDFTVEKADDGAIIVERRIQRVAGSDVELDDGGLVAGVRSVLADNSRVDAGGLDVTAADGAVTLRGEVTSREEAAEIIRTALEAEGVHRVVSYVTWRSLP